MRLHNRTCDLCRVAISIERVDNLCAACRSLENTVRETPVEKHCTCEQNFQAVFKRSPGGVSPEDVPPCEWCVEHAGSEAKQIEEGFYRDMFAAFALIGLVHNYSEIDTPDMLASSAYALAAAMMEARKE